eukprot:8929844-Alexandrium_andersonii.AAC.1
MTTLPPRGCRRYGATPGHGSARAPSPTESSSSSPPGTMQHAGRLRKQAEQAVESLTVSRNALGLRER